MARALNKLWTTEDYWAIWLGLGIVLLALGAYWSGGSIKAWAVSPGSWSAVSELGADLARTVTEKHFALDRADLEAGHSLLPEQFRKMRERIW